MRDSQAEKGHMTAEEVSRVRDMLTLGTNTRSTGADPSSSHTVQTEWGTVTRGALPVVTAADLSTSNPLTLRSGQLISLEGPTGLGLTRVGLSMLAEPSRHAPVVVVDVRGWLSPVAAWEVGVRPDRLVVVRCADVEQWPGVVAALLEGVKAIYAEVPNSVPESILRRLSAMARSRDAGVVLRPLSGRVPSGVAFLRVRAERVIWSGAVNGHGRLEARRLVLECSGKGAAGRSQRVEVEDDGTHLWKNNVRVVSRLAAQEARRNTG